MEFSRILIRATNWVGDAVMCVPALEALRARYPHAHIAVLARPWVAGLYGKELVDELIPYTAAKGWKELGAKRELAKQLGTMNFDAAILLQNAFEAAAIVWMAGFRFASGTRAMAAVLCSPIESLCPKLGPFLCISVSTI